MPKRKDNLIFDKSLLDVIQEIKKDGFGSKDDGLSPPPKVRSRPNSSKRPSK